MVTKDDGAYRCDICSPHYEDKETARECERFCREHDACSTAIFSDTIETQ